MKKCILALFSVFLIAGFVSPLVRVGSAQTAKVYVDPAQVTGLHIGDSFSINVTVTDVTDLAGWEFQLFYNPQVLNATGATEGPFLKNVQSTFFLILGMDDNYNVTHGRVYVACTTMPVVGVSGSGVLASVSFKIVGAGQTVLALPLVTTKLLDSLPESPQPIPRTTTDGFISVMEIPAPPPPFRIDLQGFTNESFPPSGFPKLVIRRGETSVLEIQFTRQNTNETVSVWSMLYGIAPDFDAWVLGGVQNMSLPDGITYSINPSGLELSTNTTYSANLTIVTSPNARVGNFKVVLSVWFYLSQTGSGTALAGEPFTLEATLKSDLNKDGIVNILDVTTVAKAFGSKLGDANWNPRADLDNNGVINIVDVAKVARDYGRTVS